MWREAYAAALREHNAAPANATRAAETFLATAFEKVDADAVATKARLAQIGQELLLSMAQLNETYGSLPCHEKLGGIQLQAISRLLCCCQDGVFSTVEVTSAPARPLKRTKKKNNNKKRTRPDMRAELRELLDRIALLMDSASPPSITETEDEPSPFHRFLQSVLEARLGSLLPSTFATIREDYELVDDEDTPRVRPPMGVASVTALKAATAPSSQPDIGPTSILSALKDERPATKNPRLMTQDPFKQVVLPSQSLPPRGSTCRHRRLEFGKTPSTSTQPTTPGTAKRPHTDTGGKSLVSLIAASKKARSTPTSRVGIKPRPAMPLLIRNVDRSLLPQRGHTPKTTPSLAGGRAPPSTTREPTRAPHHGATTVMRTPDRPHRVKHAQPRILVVSSPPLRRPSASARSRAVGPRLPQ